MPEFYYPSKGCTILNFAMAECFFSLKHIFIIKKVHIKWDVVISSFFIVDIINERDHTFMTSKKKV